MDRIPRHPSQLYEAVLEGFMLFIILIVLTYKKSANTGLVSALFMVLYGQKVRDGVAQSYVGQGRYEIFYYC